MNPFDRRREEIDEELRAHLNMATNDRIDRGEAAGQARAEATREMGNIGMVSDTTREVWGWLWLERLLQDTRYAFRQLVRYPGFTLAVIGTLALGLGATAAMFTVVERVVLRPLPYHHERELVSLTEAGPKGPSWGAPFLDIQDWRSSSHTLQQIAFYTRTDGLGHLSFLEGKNSTTLVDAPHISGNLFSMLGAQPVLGRAFQQEAGTGAVSLQDEHSLMLSDSAWRNVYGGDPAIIGQTVKLSGVPYTVIGVMPQDFAFPYAPSKPLVWLPVTLGNGDKHRDRRDSTYVTIGRLAPGVTIDQARAEMNVIQRAVAKNYTDPYDRTETGSMLVERYSDTLVPGELEKPLWALLGASAVLWLIACVNVTGLLLARSTTREREVAVRGALGAGRLRIVQQLLVEGLLLSAAGAVCGIAIALLTVRGFEYTLQSQFKVFTALTPDLRVVLALLGLTFGTTVVACLWPAISAAGNAIEPALRQGGAQAGTTKHRYRARGTLVVVEVAMSLTLLAGCGLLLRTIYALRHVPLGFRTDHIMVGSMSIPAYKYGGKDLQSELYQPLLERVQALPGVESAALVTEVPLGKSFQMLFTLRPDGSSPVDVRRREMRSQLRAVSPDVQKVFDFRMWKGRFFNQGDTATSAPVVVVNRAFAKAYLNDGQDPSAIIGETLVNYSKNRRASVVGILDDERQMSIAEQSEPELEVCLPQITRDSMFYAPAESMAMDIAVRTRREPETVVPELHALMRNASPELANSNFITMDQIVEDSFGSQRMAARSLELFAGAALLLCMAGIYGLLAYLVTQRTREFGLRIALGARRHQVVWLVMRQAVWLLVAGAAIGLLLAYLASFALQTLLYGVKAHDPWTLAVVALVLLSGGLLAAYFPAIRAARLDPTQALRTE